MSLEEMYRTLLMRYEQNLVEKPDLKGFYEERIRLMKQQIEIVKNINKNTVK